MADIANVAVLKPFSANGVSAAPVGTTLPTGATAASSALDADFEALGYITDDGLTDAEDRGDDSVAGWGGDTIASTSSTYTKTFQFTVAEYLNAAAWRTVVGDANVTETPATSGHGNLMTITETGEQAPMRSWIIDMVGGDGVRVRKVIARGRLTSKGDTTFNNDDPAGIDITITAYRSGTGSYVVTYTDDGQKTA